MAAKKKSAGPHEVTSIRLPPPIKSALVKAAEADGRSVSNYLMQMILKDLRDKGLIK